MIKNITFILFFLSYYVAQAQLTLTLDAVPSNTPASASIYVAGTFNNWDAGNEGYILNLQQDGSYQITFTPTVGELKFKFTRGAWASVETTAQGGFVPDRVLMYDGSPTEVSLQVLGWEDLSGGNGGNSTASANVMLLDEDFYMPQLNRNRRIWIYFPPDYESSDKNYPVIYMHDAQNLFDAATSFSGEWEVDESLNALANAGDYGSIVIGIENGGAARIEEYTPWSHPTYGGGQGDAYVQFIVNTLKPYVDANYRTLPDRANTGIAGSSLGGLISFYAAIEHQDVFGKAGILSPSFWFSEQAYQHVSQTGKEAEVKFYFVAGSNESTDMISDMDRMRDSLLAVGFTSNDIAFVQHADGQHSEWYWAREFPALYAWLCGNQILTTTATTELTYRVKLYPNPANDSLRFEAKPTKKIFRLQVFTLQGERVLDQAVNLSDALDISSLAKGTYIVQIQNKGQVIFTEQLIIR